MGERPIQPDPAHWLMWRRTLNHWGYSPLNQINRNNVRNLTLVSDTAEFGDLTRGKKVVDEHVEASMQQILDDIRSGAFAREWVLENKAGQVGFKALRARHAAHASEAVGRQLREPGVKELLRDLPAGEPHKLNGGHLTNAPECRVLHQARWLRAGARGLPRRQARRSRAKHITG